jgi:hypothetical protein
MHAEPLEHARAMPLHGAYTDSQIVGDHLVRFAGEKADQHLAFARAERANQFSRPHHLQLSALLPAISESTLDHGQ